MFLIPFVIQDKAERKEAPLTAAKVASKTQRILDKVRTLILGSLGNLNLHENI